MFLMSRFVGSVFKLFFANSSPPEERHGEPASVRRRSRKRREGAPVKVRGRERAVQYADSFIFVPSDTGQSRSRSNTESNVTSNRILLGKSIKSRISQEIEDRSSTRPAPNDQSFADPLYQRLSLVENDRCVPPRGPYEIHCPPGEKYCDIRPQSCHSLGREYAMPTDCIQPTSRYVYSEDDLESLVDCEGFY